MISSINTNLEFDHSKFYNISLVTSGIIDSQNYNRSLIFFKFIHGEVIYLTQKSKDASALFNCNNITSIQIKIAYLAFVQGGLFFCYNK